MKADSRGQARPDPAATDANVCPSCNGTGWRVAADGGNGAASPCECRKLRLGQELLVRADIPERHRDCRFDTFSTSNRTAGEQVRATQLQARRASELYVDRFLDTESGTPRATGLLYVGPPGTGKTHLATAVLHALIERYSVRGRFVNFTRLVYDIQATFDANVPGTKQQVLDPVTNADVLVLDELGATKPTDWVQDTLYLIINERYVNNRPTIITTNYQLDTPSRRARSDQPTRPHRDASTDVSDSFASQALDRRSGGGGGGPTYGALATRISPMLVSRLFEMTQVISMGHWDYRQRVLMNQRAIGR